MPEYRKSYTMPQREIDAIENLGMTFETARTAFDGYLSSWIERKRFERDGTTWITLQERGQGYAAEIALDAFGDVTRVIPLPPGEARALES